MPKYALGLIRASLPVIILWNVKKMCKMWSMPLTREFSSMAVFPSPSRTRDLHVSLADIGRKTPPLPSANSAWCTLCEGQSDVIDICRVAFADPLDGGGNSICGLFLGGGGVRPSQVHLVDLAPSFDEVRAAAASCYRRGVMSAETCAVAVSCDGTVVCSDGGSIVTAPLLDADMKRNGPYSIATGDGPVLILHSPGSGIELFVAS